MGIRYQVDMDKPTQVTRLSTRLYQGDEEANRITLELVRGGKQANVGTLTVTGEMERADGVRVPCEGSQSGSTVSIVLNEHCYYVPGPCVIYLMASTGGVLRTMLELHGQVVQKSAGPMVDVNEELVDVDAVIQLYSEMRTAKEGAERATAAADEAATDAANAATRANDAAQSIEGLTVSASPGAAADAEITEQDGAKHIHFVLQTGATPDITFTVATGAPGTQVQVQQSGTPEAPSVLLTIPRGDTGSVEGLDYYAGSPSDLGTASPGESNEVARGDHVHPMPTAEQVGALPTDGTAADANKLGGKDASVYLLVEDAGLKMELLWENASPTSEFGEQSLSGAEGLTMEEYDGAFVIACLNATETTVTFCAFVGKGNTGAINWHDATSESYVRWAMRRFSVSGNGIAFDAGYRTTQNAGTFSIAKMNSYCIPLRVYGVKGVG